MTLLFNKPFLNTSMDRIYLDLNGNIDKSIKLKPKLNDVSSEKCLKLRVVFYSVNLLIVLVNTYDLLTKDFQGSQDRRVSDVEKIRFRFGTIWNYIIFGCYMPIAITVDILELKKHPMYENFADFRHFWMTALTATPTAFVSLFFWMMWWYDRELIVPSYLDVMVGMVNQHCLHTLTMATVIFDLALVPRKRPDNFEFYKHVSFGYMILYTFVIIFTYMEKSIWVYPFLADMTYTAWFVFFAFNCTAWGVLLKVQWAFIDLCWRNNHKIE